MEEIWKDIEGYEGLYQVSNLGRIKSFVRKKTRILTGYKNGNNDYPKIKLKNAYGKIKMFYIHRLVAFYFCEGYEKGLVVDHIDGNKLNNISTNLEWVTYSENNKRAYDNGLKKWNPSEKMLNTLKENHSKNSKKIKAFLPNGYEVIFPSGYSAGRYLGMHGEGISYCIRRNRPNRKGIKFERVE